MSNKYNFGFAGKSVKENGHLDLLKVSQHHSTSVFTFLIAFGAFIVVLFEPNIPPFIGWWITYFQIESSTLLLKLITSLITFANLQFPCWHSSFRNFHVSFQSLLLKLCNLEFLSHKRNCYPSNYYSS
jgi:hypothetical protein